jgi:hypothetical protein
LPETLIERLLEPVAAAAAVVDVVDVELVVVVAGCRTEVAEEVAEEAAEVVDVTADEVPVEEPPQAASPVSTTQQEIRRKASIFRNLVIPAGSRIGRD